jgi:predicted nucleic acid-binding protein
VSILVDTSIWSLALRRSGTKPAAQATELASLVRRGEATMIGAIRQELLSGVKSRAQFDELKARLQAFPDLLLETGDYEEAADFFNRCRARGIQGSNTDFLICAVAARRELSIFTTDRDFVSFARLLPIELHAPKD